MSSTRRTFLGIVAVAPVAIPAIAAAGEEAFNHNPTAAQAA